MKTILCFGDSNTWGWNPAASEGAPLPVRHDFDVRWPGVLRRELGEGWHVIEEGQNGRTTVHDDPIETWRNGHDYLTPCLQSHSPIDLVILMLGTNDLKARFALPASDIAAGVGVLVRIIQQSQAGRDGKAPAILLVCPPAVGNLDHQSILEMFADAEAKSRKLPPHYEALAKSTGCAYLNAQDFTVPSPVDAIHLEATEHLKLGKAVAAFVVPALAGMG